VLRVLVRSVKVLIVTRRRQEVTTKIRKPLVAFVFARVLAVSAPLGFGEEEQPPRSFVFFAFIVSVPATTTTLSRPIPQTSPLVDIAGQRQVRPEAGAVRGQERGDSRHPHSFVLVAAPACRRASPSSLSPRRRQN